MLILTAVIKAFDSLLNYFFCNFYVVNCYTRTIKNINCFHCILPLLLRFCPAAFSLFPPSWLLWKHSLGSNHQAVIENQTCFEQVGIFHYECFACDVLYFTVFCYNFVSHVQWVFSLIETMYRLSSLYCFILTFPYNDFLLSLDFKICFYIYKNTTIYNFVLMKNFAGNCESKWQLLITPIQWAESTLYSLEWQWE